MKLFKGDINGDKRITLEDLLIAQLYSLGDIMYTPNQLSAADVNNDGVANISDLLDIQRHFNGVKPIVEYIEV